jgi:hypothetical protein
MVNLHWICAAVLFIVVSGRVNGQQDCGFSDYHLFGIAHFDRMAVNRVTPQYPADAEERGWTGTVQIAVVVDVTGKVVKTCPVYASGKPIPHGPLIAAASAAAKQWTFRPNFGLGPDAHPRFSHVRHVLLFRFALPEKRATIGVPRERFNAADLAGFTKSPTEHAIVPMETDFFVERIEGVIVSKVDGRPMQNVLFEVRGPSEGRSITRGQTDRSGRFRLKRLRPGVYLFKTTADGFQSVIGTVVVGVFNKPTPIRIEIPPGV